MKTIQEYFKQDWIYLSSVSIIFVVAGFALYNAGHTNGMINLCESQDSVLVEKYGVKQCITIYEFEQYIKRQEANQLENQIIGEGESWLTT